jgi:predicted phage terminase large subunit-like protein
MCFAALHFPKHHLNWHLVEIARHLEAVLMGSILRLTVAAPLRHGKSWLCTVVFAAWFLSRNPELNVMIICYGEDLAFEFGRDVRNILNSPVNQLLFPACRLSRDSTAADRFHTTAGGGLAALGLGSAIFGRGADLILMDDSLRDPRDARREALRLSLREFFSQVIYSRLSPAGRIVVSAARTHPLDLTGHLLRFHADDGWVPLSYAAVAEKDEPPHRKKGEALWPSRFPLPRLRRMEATFGSVAWDGLMQQRPRESTSVIFNPDFWQWVDGEVRSFYLVQSWDLAHKVADGNDYSACVTLLFHQGRWLIVDVFREKLEFPDLVQKVEEHARRWKVRKILVEESGPGIPLVQVLKGRLGAAIEGIRPVGSKEARAHAATDWIKTGRLQLHRKAKGIEDLLQEAAAFPDGEHDDLIDALTQAINHLQETCGLRPEELLDIISGPAPLDFSNPYADPLDWTPPFRR